MASSLEVRNDLARVLRLDLVGPDPGHALEREAVEIAPSRFYLTGFLVPHESNEEWKSADDGHLEDLPDEDLGLSVEPAGPAWLVSRFAPPIALTPKSLKKLARGVAYVRWSTLCQARVMLSENVTTALGHEATN